MKVMTNRMDVDIVDASLPKEETSNSIGGGGTVILLNNDDTYQKYVVAVLASVFSLNHNESEETMMMAHTSGSAVVGSYLEKQAIALLTQVDSKNQQSGNRLRCIIMDIK